ncbi:MAG: hypothetical protein FJZ56_00900 [Chlamydiae bacterium]|nr:hypothetical protein [Chlamydiota bacterium]
MALVNDLRSTLDTNIYQEISNFASENQAGAWEVTGAFAEVFGNDTVLKVADFAADSLVFPEILASLGEVANAAGECVEIFSAPCSSNREKGQVARELIGSTFEFTSTNLSAVKFLAELEVVALSEQSEVLIDGTKDALNILVTTSNIIDNVASLMTIAERSQEEGRTPYEITKDSFSSHVNIWQLVKNSASCIGSIVGLAAVIAGLALSAWIVAAVAVVVFAASVALYWVQGEEQKYENAHVLDKIITQLNPR